MHRAFSVFLFNENGELLLQQRAASKITFPNVWTNTCCSHPLYGYEPNEVDTDDSIQSGDVPGAKAAAIRKLKHELGISSKKIKASEFKFLTRLHYWAADVVTHGAESPWGEHEIDYILFIQGNVRVAANEDEVSNTMYVTLPKLKSMMEPSSGLLWSPWFRIIVENFLVHWWADLEVTFSTNKFVDTRTIYRFDPTSEHMGGAGNARDWLGKAKSPYSISAVTAPAPLVDTPRSGDKGSKQGAYGKVKIHKHSIMTQLYHFDEVIAAFWLLYVEKMNNKLLLSNDDVKFCDDILDKVSRSFAGVIRQLPEGLCLDILIFYLVLRALDTIEDDMEAFKSNPGEKIERLNNFYKLLGDESWSLQNVGEADEKRLLEQFYRCNKVYNTLSKDSQIVIADITRKMGQGMASFVEKDLGQGTVNSKDYDLYCHYVAGLVGEGLSRLFTSCGYEGDEVQAVSKTLANTMGLFLQKTNIIRDYLEDFVDGRTFWPQQVWKKYTKSSNLGELADPENSVKAVQCLNEMVTNALECVPECLKYLDLLHTGEVFRFCAIPQIMAIATLADLYGNKNVFTGVVKIRKGMAAQLILDTKTISGVHKWFYTCATDISRRVQLSDPHATETIAICNKIRILTESNAKFAFILGYLRFFNTLSTGVVAVSGYRLLKSFRASSLDSINFLYIQENIIAVSLFVISILFIISFRIMKSGEQKFN